MYKGAGNVNADGSDDIDVDTWRHKLAMDNAAAAHPSGGASDDSDDDAALEAAMEAALDAASSRANCASALDDYDEDLLVGDESDSADEHTWQKKRRAGKLSTPKARKKASQEPSKEAPPDGFSKV